MMVKKISLGILLWLVAMTSFAAKVEIASQVVLVKSPVVEDVSSSRVSIPVVMEIKNLGRKRHTLVAATAPIAKQVQLHMTINRQGKMRQVQGIIIKPHTEQDLQENGLHVMLIGLKKGLQKNEDIPIKLIFRDGSWVVVHAKVA